MRRITFLFSGLMLLAAGVAPAQQGVTLTGVVLDSLTGRPLDGVMVYLSDRTSDRTGQQGQFQLRRVPAEETFVMFRRIGYSPRALRLNLDRRDGLTIDLGWIRLWPVPVGMDEVVIETRLVQRNPRMNEFYRRLKAGHGQYVTRQDIWKKNPIGTSEMLRGIPGVTVNCAYLTACTPATMRKSSSLMTQGEMTCPMRVLLDGQPVAMSVDEIPPAWIAGIEIYRSAAFTPLELMSSRGNEGHGSSQCGTVAIWTGGDDY